MKRILILAVAFFFALTAEAQIVSSSSNTYTIHIEGYRYVKAGLVYSSDSMLGYNFAYGVLAPIKSIDNLLYGGEVAIGMRGNSYIHLHGLSVTPTLAYDIALSRQIVLQPHAGLFASYDFLGFVGYAGERERIESFENYRPFDFGADLGVRIWFNHHIMLDASYKPGLVDTFYKYSPMKSSALVFSVGINF